MKKVYPSSQVIPLLFLLFFITSCNGQVETKPLEDKPTTSATGPEIIGTPPPLGSYLDPVTTPIWSVNTLEVFFRIQAGIIGLGQRGKASPGTMEKPWSTTAKLRFLRAIIA